MRKQGAMLTALVLLGVISVFPQAKEPAKQPAQPAQQAAQAPAQEPAKPAPMTPIVIPPEAAKKANPVKPTARSLEAGKQRYDIDCAMCHAKDGSGKTPLATNLKVTMPDFRDAAALKSVTDGGLFYVISKGAHFMPNEDTRAKPHEIWNLVNYVRSFSEKKSPHKSK